MQKILPVLLILGAVAYALVIRKPKIVEAAPAPAPVVVAPLAAPVPTGPIAPDLKIVSIKGRSDITNAVVYDITANGITFKCDQGLVQARFSDLSPEFADYYGTSVRPSLTAAPTPMVTRSQQSAPAKNAPAKKIEPEKDELWKARRKAVLAEEMRKRETLMNQYMKQSQFVKQEWPRVTTEAYDLAKLELEKFKAEYDELR